MVIYNDFSKKKKKDLNAVTVYQGPVVRKPINLIQD